MSESKNSLLKPAIAVAVGIVVGAALGSRGGDAEVAMKRQIEALQAQLAESGAAIEGRVAALEGAEIDLSPVEGAVAEVTARLDELQSTVAAEVEGLAAAQDRVTVLGQQLAALAARFATNGGAPASAAVTPAALEAPAAAEEQAPADGGASALEEALGEDGVALAAGQTATIGGTTIFLSRMDAAANQALVIVVGQGRQPVAIGDGASPLQLADGCALQLLGVEGRRAFLKPAC